MLEILTGILFAFIVFLIIEKKSIKKLIVKKV
jgi:multisubunit Na+/H+ antiporter MnhC subunit